MSGLIAPAFGAVQQYIHHYIGRNTSPLQQQKMKTASIEFNHEYICLNRKYWHTLNKWWFIIGCAPWTCGATPVCKHILHPLIPTCLPTCFHYFRTVSTITVHIVITYMLSWQVTHNCKLRTIGVYYGECSLWERHHGVWWRVYWQLRSGFTFLKINVGVFTAKPSKNHFGSPKYLSVNS